MHLLDAASSIQHPQFRSIEVGCRLQRNSPNPQRCARVGHRQGQGPGPPQPTAAWSPQFLAAQRGTLHGASTSALNKIHSRPPPPHAPPTHHPSTHQIRLIPSRLADAHRFRHYPKFIRSRFSADRSIPVPVLDSRAKGASHPPGHHCTRHLARRAPAKTPHGSAAAGQAAGPG